MKNTENAAVKMPPALLAEMLGTEPEYKALSETLSAFKAGGAAYRAGVCYATGLCDTLRALLLAMLVHDEKIVDRTKTSLLIAPDEKTAYRYKKYLSVLTDGVFVFPQRDIVLHNVNAASHDFEHERISVLKKALDGKAKIIIAVPEAVLGVVPTKGDIRRKTVIAPGVELPPEKLVSELMCYGYTRCESVEGKGQFARRGDIVDVFVPSEDAPTRIEYFGDEVDTVNYFDIMTQRRTETVGTLDITPTREILITESEADIIRTKITEEIAAVKAACNGKLLKVIIETCLLTDEEKIALCRCVSDSGADYIKTSTGFSKAGATFHDVELFAAHVAPHVKIKAAGGISSLADAEKFITLGASRLGTSRIVKIAKGLEGSGY